MATKAYVDGLSASLTSGRSRVVEVTSAYTAQLNDAIAADTSAGGFAITLPAPVNGGSIRIRRYDNAANPGNRFLTINAASGTQIDNISSTIISDINFPNDALYFASDGTKWYRV